MLLPENIAENGFFVADPPPVVVVEELFLDRLDPSKLDDEEPNSFSFAPICERSIGEGVLKRIYLYLIVIVTIK